MSEPRKLTDAAERELRRSRQARKTDPPLPDEDLTTPEHLLHDLGWMLEATLPVTPQASLEKTAGIIARGLVTYALDRENQAYMLGCVLAAPFTHKMRTVPAILFVVCAGLGAKCAYRATRDLHDLVEAAKRPGAGPDADAPVPA